MFSNAGHNPPLLVRKSGSFERLSDGGTVLGVFPDTPYDQGEMPLEAGDRLIFYTDGITEARNPAGDEYGEQQLAAAAIGCRTDPAEVIKDALLADVNGFTGGHFDDDATLIVLAVGQ